MAKEKGVNFRVKELWRLKKSEGKNAIYYPHSAFFACVNNHGNNLQGVMEQQTKDRGD